MNIFALHPDPVIAASYHCDQHLGVMIKESAQMLCSVMHNRFPGSMIPYKATHQKHPCTIWLQESDNNIAWLIRLCYALEQERFNRNLTEHASTEVIRFADAFLCPDKSATQYVKHSPFIFCGPDRIGWRNDLDVHQKYQRYYREKHAAWLDTRRPMTYKNRPIPPFMADLF